jgi:hypothetical protein
MVMDDSEDEPDCNHHNDLCDFADAFKSPEPQMVTDKQSTQQRQFLSMDDEDIATAKVFVHQRGKLELEKVEWDILADGDNVNLGMPDIANHYPIQEIPCDSDTTLDDIFFERILPAITGHGKLVDEYLTDQHSEYHITVRNEKIIFHDSDATDQYWWVKQCYTLLIAARSEIEDGAKNLWKSGPAIGRRDYPDFGQYCTITMLYAFRSAAPTCSILFRGPGLLARCTSLGSGPCGCSCHSRGHGITRAANMTHLPVAVHIQDTFHDDTSHLSPMMVSTFATPRYARSRNLIFFITISILSM